MPNRRPRGRKWRRLFVAFLLLGLLWLISWVGALALIVSVPLDRVDAIVMLSGSSSLAERTQHASKLYLQRRSQKILLTTDNHQGGWSEAEQRNPYFHEIARNELVRLGVPKENIEIVGPAVTSTWEEGLAIGDYVSTHQLNSVLIVTSSYHSRRALWTFRTLLPQNTRIGIDPVPTGIQTPDPETWWLKRRGWQLVFIEYLKLIYYLCRSI